MRSRDLGFATLSGLALALHFASWFESLEWTSVAASVTLVQSQPLFVALGAWLLLREHINRRMTLGILVAVVGMATMSMGDLLGGVLIGPNPHLGNGLALFGAVMAAGYVLVGRSLRQRVSLVPYVVVVYSACTVCLLGIALLQGGPLTGYPAREWLIFVGLAVGPGLLGHTVINWALAHLESSVVSVSMLGEPVGATILAFRCSPKLRWRTPFSAEWSSSSASRSRRPSATNSRLMGHHSHRQSFRRRTESDGIQFITIGGNVLSFPMNRDRLLPTLGHCPLCEEELDSEYLLAAYTVEDGWPRMLAECPFCTEVVHPV